MGRVIQLKAGQIASFISKEVFLCGIQAASNISKEVTLNIRAASEISKYVTLKGINIATEIKALFSSQYLFTRCPIATCITQLNYFNSMEGNDENAILTAPTLEEYNAKQYWRAWLVCPELGVTYEIPNEDLGEPFVEWQLNTPITFGFTLKNFDRKYTDPDDATWADLMTKDHWSAIRHTRKFVKLGLMSTCGAQKEYMYFPELVIKEVTGDLVLNIQGMDKISDLVCRTKDWDSFCPEDVCVKVDTIDAPAWKANTDYKVGDVVIWNTFTPYTIQGYTYFKFQNSDLDFEHHKFEFGADELKWTYKKTKNLYGQSIPLAEQIEIVKSFDYANVLLRCSIAGRSGSVEPVQWPLGFCNPSGTQKELEVLAAVAALAWRSMGGYSAQYDIARLAGVKALFPAGYGSVTDGSATWEAVNSQAFTIYSPMNLTYAYYKPAYGSEIRVNNIVKTEGVDFVYSENSRSITFLQAFDESFTVLFRNPISAKQVIAKVLDDSVNDIYTTIGITDQIPAVYNFKDFKCYTEIQVQNMEAVDVIKAILEAFCGEFLIMPLNENKLYIIFRDAILDDEIPQRADFVRHENLIRGKTISEGSTNAINTINVIRPARVQIVRAT